MKKTVLATMTLLVSAALGAEPTLADWVKFLSPAQGSVLMETRRLVSSPDGIPLGLSTSSPLASWFGRGPSLPQANLISEGLFIVNRGVNQTDLALYNALGAVSTMNGLTYWSVTDKKREPLILESWRLDGSSVNPVSDPVFSEIPVRQTVLIHQKDNRFGNVQTRVTWSALSDGVFGISMSNITALNLAFLTVVNAGDLQMDFAVIPVGESQFLVAARLQGRVLSVPGLGVIMGESIRNRLEALVSWLSVRIENGGRR